jgi:hypothetical protein
MYTEMYSKIGLHFALWYYKNVDKLLNKASDLDNLMSIWAKSFAFVGQQVGAQRVTLVSGTAKNTLISVTQKLMSDPAFMNQGEKVKAKMLKTQFNRYSTYQAKRLVRTEATNAANYATIVSAQSVFDGRDLMKTWHTSIDGRERASHGAANGQTVPNAGKFSVQGQFLKWAGDPAGSASNVINCRCGVSVFPKPNAQTTGENITDIGFGVAQAQVQSAITDALLTSPEVLAPIAEQIIDGTFNAKTIDEARIQAKTILENAGLKIRDVETAADFSVAEFNAYNKQLNNLTNEYKLDSLHNTKLNIPLKYDSTGNSYGYVKTINGNLLEINFGNTTDSIFNRTRNLAEQRFSTRFKSDVSEVNNKIATLTHEFAHCMITRHAEYRTVKGQEYYEELKALKRQYNGEKLRLRRRNNIEEYNKIWLGDYAETNVDEFMAEGFTEFKLSDNPSKYAIKIGELINKYFKK